LKSSSSTNSSRTPSSGDNLAVVDLNAHGWRQQIRFPRPGYVVDGLKMGRFGSLDLVDVNGLKMGVGRRGCNNDDNFDLGWAWLDFSVAGVLVVGGVLVDVTLQCWSAAEAGRQWSEEDG
ncbi:hypothetical protein Dimus_001274, partial [Dionaea muscipula]